MINAYRKHFPGSSKDEVLWGMSYMNFMMDLATIPDTTTTKKKDADETEVYVSAEDERAELLKDLGR